MNLLADRLMCIADELRCGHQLDIFADQIDAMAERIEDREVLDGRMQVADERMRKSPCGISVQYTLKSVRRDRRYQEDMRNIVKAGGRFYRGKEIKGGDDPYIIRFTRKELMAEFRHDCLTCLGLERFPTTRFPRTPSAPLMERRINNSGTSSDTQYHALPRLWSWACSLPGAGSWLIGVILESSNTGISAGVGCRSCVSECQGLRERSVCRDWQGRGRVVEDAPR